MTRSVKPELLDYLSPSDPLAVRSREDLKRVNAWMANASLLANEVDGLATRPKRWLELGAGDGTLLLKIFRRIRPQPNREITLFDQQNLLTEKAGALYGAFGASVRVRQSDVLDWAEESSPEHYDVILCNLFLHHFREPELKVIFAKISRCAPFFAACEPRRSKMAVFMTNLLWLIGCNYVTRHDARVSVEAGFAGDELGALWPKTPGWVLTEKPGGIASHLFTARRSDA